MPTETVYGLAADATNGEAVARIYAAKGRPSFNPLIVHVRDLRHGRSKSACSTMRRGRWPSSHWPGPLTLVLPLRTDAGIASLVTAGLSTVALRVPAHPAMRGAACEPSAGRSPRLPPMPAAAISPTRAEHVLASLGGRIPLIVDGGPTAHGLESTIVAATGGAFAPAPPRSHRDPARDCLDRCDDRSAGPAASHYAPAKPLRLNAADADADEWLIGFAEVAGNASLSAEGDLVEAARGLFDLLHDADASDEAAIAVAPIPETGSARRSTTGSAAPRRLVVDLGRTRREVVPR